MLRQIKTNLTKDDLHKPALNIDDAVLADSSMNSLTGALLLPEHKDVTEALASAPVVAKSDDWMRVGDPEAPALKELEERAREERERVMQQAALANAAPPVMDAAAGPVLVQTIDLPSSSAAAVPAQDTPAAPTIDLGTVQYPWAPGAVQPAEPVVDDVDDFARDMKVNFGAVEATALDPLQAAGNQAATTTPVASDPVPFVYPADDAVAPTGGAAMPSVAIADPIPIAATPNVTDEVVLHIPHDPPKLIMDIMPRSVNASQAIIGTNDTNDAFAAGATVQIPHDESALQSLPYAGPRNPKQSSYQGQNGAM